jgi:hypothetical protein
MPTTDKTISQVFDEFLADQEVRLKPKTLAKYRSIIDLFQSYLESYWPGHSHDEYSKVKDEGGTFCDTFGPEEILSGYSEFLGYFIPHKVMCGKETMQAAGTVTKKLANWLAEKGYADETPHGNCPPPRTCWRCWKSLWTPTPPMTTRTKSRTTSGSRRSNRESSGWRR